MPSEKELQNFVINRLESQDVYDHLVQTGQINNDELYLIQGEGEVATEDKNGLMASSDKQKLNGIEEGATNTVVDDTLNSTSATHALSANQGKILNDKIKSISDNIGELGGGDMLKATYDSDDDGKVDAAASADVAANAEKLGGQSPTYYAAKSDIPTIPDVVSAFTNDAGYLTEHQDISGKLDTTGDGSNVVVSFSTASSRSNLSSGEKLSALFGKAAKWFSDFGSLAFKSVVSKSDLDSSVQTSLNKADSALQSFTETDPTVSAWAKADTKPSYTAAEVGALPDTTVIPTKTSQLTNDSGYLTSHQDISGKLDKTGDGSSVTTSFTQASTRSNISSGETLKNSMSKISKWFADLGSLAFSSSVSKGDLASDVQASLDKADTAIQSLDGYATQDYVDGIEAVSYGTSQTLTNEQQTLARENIDAQQRPFTYELGDPIAENVEIAAGETYTVGTSVELIKNDQYFLSLCDASDVRYDIFGTAYPYTVNDSAITVRWLDGYIVYDGTHIENHYPWAIHNVTIQKVLSWSPASSEQILSLEGKETSASGLYAHAEGANTIASGSRSHVEGSNSVASGKRSHAEGNSTIAASDEQHVQGKYNVADAGKTYAHIIGNGTAEDNRSNAHTIDWSGNAWYAGDVYVGGTGQNDAAAKKLGVETMYIQAYTSDGVWTLNGGYTYDDVKALIDDNHPPIIYIKFSDNSRRDYHYDYINSSGTIYFIAPYGNYLYVYTIKSDGTMSSIYYPLVTTSRTINGHALSANITLTSDDVKAVSYDTAQTLTDDQKVQARENIGAQSVLTFDSTPTADSTNPVTSGGIYTALDTHISDTDLHVTAEEKAGWNAKADAPFKPAGKSYLTFSSPSSFTLKVYDATKHWGGTLEYFSSDSEWATWDGTTLISSRENDGEHVIYLRGTGNTKITGNSPNYRWVLTGTNISCIGNIETILDYATVENGSHPTIGNNCYQFMFYDCTGLTQAPKLPATTLAYSCYADMFQGCTGLTQAPDLPATTVVYNCYSNMFYGCTALTTAPKLPATSLEENCYQNMFRGCTSLTEAPELPAITLWEYCYNNMFYGCTSLTKIPALPATTLAPYCYDSMFYGCTKIKLSVTQTDEYNQEYRIPPSGTGTTATDALYYMFTSTGGTFTGTPEINTTYYLSNTNTIVREGPVESVNGMVGNVTIDVPTKTSELTNDSGYLTSSDLSAIEAVLTSV